MNDLSTGDGYVGFADFVLFMHGQDPKVAEKRGICGPAAINVALANQHLHGPNAKGFPSAGSINLASPSFSPSNATRRGQFTLLENNTLQFDQQAPVPSSMTPAQPSSPDQSRGFSFNHDNGLGFGGSVSPSSAASLAAKLPLQQKRYMRVKRGEFAGFDRYRSPRLAAKSSTGRATTPLSDRSRPGTPGFATVNVARSSFAGATTTTGGFGNKTINGVRVPSARYPYRGDTIKSLSEESQAKSSITDRERLLTYVADVYQEQDAHRAERVALEQQNRRQRDARGHAISGCAVLWRTDAGEPLETSHEVLVPAGPVYWDSSRAHLHELAFADEPPALGRPRPTSSSSSPSSLQRSSMEARKQLGRGASFTSGSGPHFGQSGREESSRPFTTTGAFARSSTELPLSSSSSLSPSSRFGFTLGPPVGGPQELPATASRPSGASTAAEGERWLEDEVELSPASAAVMSSSDAAVARRRMRHQIAKSSAPRSPVFTDHAGPAHMYTHSKPVSEERRGASRPLMTHHN